MADIWTWPLRPVITKYLRAHGWECRDSKQHKDGSWAHPRYTASGGNTLLPHTLLEAVDRQLTYENRRHCANR